MNPFNPISAPVSGAYLDSAYRAYLATSGGQVTTRPYYELDRQAQAHQGRCPNPSGSWEYNPGINPQTDSTRTFVVIYR